MSHQVTLLFLLGLSLGISACQTPQQAGTSQKPNILILLADDMGYADLGSYGGVAHTPNLDALAAQGIRFTDCYAGAPNCSPSRVSLLTGRIPARAGMYSYRPPNHPMHLLDAELTLAEFLKPAGYQTAHIGKWHLGCLPQDSLLNQPQPGDQGFDYSLGTENNAIPSHLNPVNFVRNGQELGEVPGYACQILADEAEQWFTESYQEDAPFFLYMAFHEPHRKVASPPDLIANYPEHSPKDAEYFANIENLDLAIGRVLNLLQEKGLTEETLIFFASDNGPYRMGSQGSLRGLKGEVYEGGIRVPGIASFPGTFAGGRVVETPIWFPDLFPTLAALTDQPMPGNRPYDGISLLPLLRGEAVKRTQPMFWYFYRSSPELAMRSGDDLLIGRADDPMPRTHWLADRDMEWIQNLQPTFYEYYDLRQDIGQQVNLAANDSVRLAALVQEMNQLKTEVQAEGPAWQGLPAYDSTKANHLKAAEFIRNQERFLEQR